MDVPLEPHVNGSVLAQRRPRDHQWHGNAGIPMPSILNSQTFPFADDKVVSIQEAAVVSGVSASTLKRQAKAQKLQILQLSPRRIGIRLSEIHRWLNNCAA
jgi:hypothetical protein